MSLSYPGVLKQQHSDQGNDIRFSKTLKQECATHVPQTKSGLGAEVLLPAERVRFSSKHYGF